MFSWKSVRRLIVVCALATASTASMAQIVISASIAPPPLPVYAQPIAPGDGYLWTPGYWAYGPDGYYWVPGVWVRPPRIGYLWTPPYWGFVGGFYGFHSGYWGARIGYYGGINYGYGYGGLGYVGGRWNGGVFAYNTAVSNVNVNVVRNTYVESAPAVVATARASYNGGGGVHAQPTPDEARAAQEPHVGATASQQAHFQAAQQNRSQYASANGGSPATLAVARANEVNARHADRPDRAANQERRQAQREGRQEQHQARQEGHAERPHGPEHDHR